MFKGVKYPYPIVKKYIALQNNNLEPLCKYHKICYSFIIPRVTTDINIINQKSCITNYLSSYIFYNFHNTNLKFIFLMLYSFYHIKNDIKSSLGIKLFYSFIVHTSWIFLPEISLSYLAWINTFLYYKKILPYLKRLDILFMVLLALYIYNLLGKHEYSHYIKQGFWIPLVIAHIINIS